MMMAEDAERLASLTPRQIEIVRMLHDGIIVREIAKTLTITEHTARSHVKTILAKLDVSSQLEAAALYRRVRDSGVAIEQPPRRRRKSGPPPGSTDLQRLLARRVLSSGHTQADLARAAGLSAKHVNQMLTGKAEGTLSAWQALVDAGGVQGCVDDAEAALAAVRALHRPVQVFELADYCDNPHHMDEHAQNADGEWLCWASPTGDQQCSECRNADGDPADWPCPTVTALTTTGTGGTDE